MEIRTLEELRTRLDTIIENSSTLSYCELYKTESLWEKNGKSRVYFAIHEASTDRRVSKHYAKKDYGYWDNINGEYVPGKGDASKNFDFGGNKF